MHEEMKPRFKSALSSACAPLWWTLADKCAQCQALTVRVAGGGRCEFVPQMIFLNFLFGYLCLLMVIKWVSGSTADLYHIMIYMFLQPGEGGLTCDGGCLENRMFPGQGTIQARPSLHLRLGYK